MPINQRNKKIIVFFSFLILVVLMFLKIDGGISGWDMFTARPVPNLTTQYPTPAPIGHVPLNVATGTAPTPNYFGLLPWAVRLASKEMPHVEKMIWKTYTNKEYGFEMQYPEGWKIDIGIDNYVSNIMLEKMGVDQIIHFSFIPSYGTYDNLPLSLFHTNLGLMEYLKRSYKENRGDNFVPIIKNIFINNVNWFLDDPDAYDMQSEMYAEKNDYIYEFRGTSFPTLNERNIIEHMIKSFHFIT